MCSIHIHIQGFMWSSGVEFDINNTVKKATGPGHGTKDLHQIIKPSCSFTGSYEFPAPA